MYPDDRANRPAISVIEDILANLRREDSQETAEGMYLRAAYGLDGQFDLRFQKQTGDTLPQTDATMGDPLSFANQQGLSKAHVLAIKTYTAADYKVINPAVAQDNRHQDAVKEAKEKAEKTGTDQPLRDLQTQTEEGSLHAGVAKAGLRRLESKSGKVFRGERHTEEVFKKLYLDAGQEFECKSFMSTSLDIKVAKDFALGVDGNPSRDENTVSVMLDLNVIDAKDVQDLSIYGDTEGEWMIQPGAKFRIDSIKQKRTGKPGVPPTITKWYEISMTQIS